MFGIPGSGKTSFIKTTNASNGSSRTEGLDLTRLKTGAAFMGPRYPNQFGINVNLNPNFRLNSSKGNQGAGDGSGQNIGNGGSEPPSGGDNGKKSGNSGGGGNSKGHGRPKKRKKNKTTNNPSIPLEVDGTLPVNWTTGMDAKLLFNSTDVGNDDFSPLYMAHGQLFPRNIDLNGDNSESFVSGFLDNELYQYYRDVIARNGSVATARHFRKDIFLSYLHEVIRCVQIFYTIDVILTLYENRSLDSQGVKILRMRIDETAASNYMKLKYELEKHYLPERILNFVRMSYQAYSTSLVPNSPIFMLSYKDIWTMAEDDACVEGSIESNIINDCLDRLYASKFTELRTILMDSLPSHKITLEPSFKGPIINSGFLTFWHNQTTVYAKPDFVDDDLLSTCTVKDRYASIKYFTVEDELDISYLAMKTVYRSGKYTTGLWKPNSTIHNVSPTNYSSVSRLDEGRLRRNMTDQLTSSCGISRIPIFKTEEKAFNVATRPAFGYKKSLYIDEERVEIAAEQTVRYLFNMEERP